LGLLTGVFHDLSKFSGRDYKLIKNLSENLGGRDQGLDGRIILKRILKNRL
jgi:hypothetical protein